jgi:murein DD-endopeptidase MepM/ murein hydrolase activator NlpD
MLFGFGHSVDYQGCGFHTGQDWFAPSGTPVYAIEDGTVVHVGPMWATGPGVGRGNHAVIVDHGAYRTTYSHNRSADVLVGDRVRRGDVIGEIGSEGFSRGPHLHLEKVTGAFTGDWREPFIGCDVYIDPGRFWSPF